MTRLRDIASVTGKNLAERLTENAGLKITDDDLATFKDAILESARNGIRNHKTIQEAVQRAISAAVMKHQADIDAMVSDVVVDALLTDMQVRVDGEVRRVMQAALGKISDEMVAAIQNVRKRT